MRIQPLHSALRAIRRNLLPGLLLQAVLVILFLLYVYHEGTQEFLARVAQTRHEVGWAFAFWGYFLACGVLPEILKVGFFQKGRPKRENVRQLLLSAPFWGGFGLLVDVLYRFQILLFGDNSDLGTVLAKVAFDQFFFGVIVGNPIIILYFSWVDGGWHGLQECARPNEFLRRLVEVLSAAWIVWIPGTMLVYWMPPLLQIPVAMTISAFWVLILATIRSLIERRAV